MIVLFTFFYISQIISNTTVWLLYRLSRRYWLWSIHFVQVPTIEISVTYLICEHLTW